MTISILTYLSKLNTTKWTPKFYESIIFNGTSILKQIKWRFINPTWTNAPTQQCTSRILETYWTNHKLIYFAFKLPILRPTIPSHKISNFFFENNNKGKIVMRECHLTKYLLNITLARHYAVSNLFSACSQRHNSRKSWSCFCSRVRYFVP